MTEVPAPSGCPLQIWLHETTLSTAHAEERMTGPLTRFATRAAYHTRQLPRFAWYAAHAAAVRRLAAQAREEEGESKRSRTHTAMPMPDRSRLYEDMAALFRQDLANVEAGLYPLP